MRRSSDLAGVALGLAGMVVAAWPAGCSRKTLQDRGAGGVGGSIVIGGRGGVDGGPIITDPPDGDVPDATDVPDLPSDRGSPFTGVRAYTVTAVFQRDGGTGVFPTSHTFTLALDGDRRIWVAGATAEGKTGTLDTTAAGALHTGPVSFRIGVCPGSTALYNDMTIAVDASDRLTGTGQGRVSFAGGDLVYTAEATMVLTGTRDVQAPTLGIAGDATDPFASFSVAPSEPLSPNASAVLRAGDGETIALATSGAAGTYVGLFQKPPQILRYATQYQIITDGVADLAGNAATGTGSLIFTTRPLPPLSPEDGFESVTDATFGGVRVLSGAGAPTITGAKSLYIPAVSGSMPTQPVLAVRLALAAGDSVLRFAYRTVRLSPTSFPSGAAWYVGSVGGGYAVSALPTDTGATTTTTIDGGSVTLGPLMMARFPLSADAANEVVLQRTLQVPNAACTLPIPGVDGIIIDDLRAE